MGNRTKLFNGSYSYGSYSNGYDGAYDIIQTLSIIYDGKNWNFKTYVNFEKHCYCTSCRELDDRFCMAIRESQIVPVPAGSRIQEVLTKMLVNAWPSNFD